LTVLLPQEDIPLKHLADFHNIMLHIKRVIPRAYTFLHEIDKSNRDALDKIHAFEVMLKLIS
jgi:hypothetical protein